MRIVCFYIFFCYKVQSFVALMISLSRTMLKRYNPKIQKDLHQTKLIRVRNKYKEEYEKFRN